MNSLYSSCWNTSAELLNESWNKEFAYQTLSIVDTVILPSMIGSLCSMGLVGNILFTVIRLAHALGGVHHFCTTITFLDTCNQFACNAIMIVMSVDNFIYNSPPQDKKISKSQNVGDKNECSAAIIMTTRN